ncbi:hypothetical protein [Halobellus rubicundus]|uniref:Uncharacterized protein n=1 Tax=Halobellus rubicundus TaxID=2996466 RepID=A0ABD5MDK7_9EURY
MSEEPGFGEIPGAVGDYAAGVADVFARGIVVAAAVALLLAAVPLAIVGGGVALVALAVVAPAVAAAIALELPDRLREALE